MKSKGLMFLGTASSVGKSTLATAFCRYYKSKGVKVAPFKALNISLNSYVTKDGEEMGRAQVVQAEACEIEPKAFMNPVLMKPSGNKTQVIVNGKVLSLVDAYSYKELNKYLREIVIKTYNEISREYDLMILEGSGSCAEINLRDTDIANIEMAKASNSSVILVADIDKGGVFASIYGTIMLLTEEERSLVKGVIINKFRGNKEYFKEAMKQIEKLINIPVLGVMPYSTLNIEEEDGACNLASYNEKEGDNIVIIKLPHMSNFTDFNSLEIIEGINVRYITNPKDINKAKIIIIPGSKNTISDLKFLKESGFYEMLKEKAKDEVVIVGICGGYQILGKVIKDPYGVEGEVREEEGLGFFNMLTSFNKEKLTRQITAITDNGEAIQGYEIHNGNTEINNEQSWITSEKGKVLGIKKGNIYGSYIHGIFDNENFLKGFLEGILKREFNNIHNYKKFKLEEYDKLKNILEENIDMKKVNKIIGYNE